MSDDFLVTHVCSQDDCTHVWLYPDVFESACPACGTTIPPLSIEQLAGRRQHRANGDDLPPLVISPDKGTPMHAQFTEGVRLLRQLVTDMEAQAQRLTDYADDLESKAADEKDPFVRAAYGAAKEARNQVARLKVAERKVSALFILGDDAESFAGVPLNKVPVKRQLPPSGPFIEDGANCPYCTGTLRTVPATPAYLTCGICGCTFTQNNPIPLNEPLKGAYTGEIVEGGLRPDHTEDAQIYSQAIHQHIGERLDGHIESQLKGTSVSRLDEGVERLRKQGVEAWREIFEGDGK
jgi:hypothetical protein